MKKICKKTLIISLSVIGGILLFVSLVVFIYSNLNTEFDNEEIELSRVLIEIESNNLNKQQVISILGEPDDAIKDYGNDDSPWECLFYRYDFLSRPFGAYDFPDIRVCFSQQNGELAHIRAPFKIRYESPSEGQAKTQHAEENKKEFPFVGEFVANLQEDNVSEVAQNIWYPFDRPYPLPSIQNEEELIEKYNEIFDETVKQEIINAYHEGDWGTIGWRGVQIDHGTIWFADNGKAYRLNRASELEEKLRTQIIEDERQSLHESLQEFDKPLLYWETENYKVRVDEMEKWSYRYAAWSSSQDMNEEPELVIENGGREYWGNGGNSSYIFESGDYIYELYLGVLVKPGAPSEILRVYRNDDSEYLHQKKIILSEEAIFVRE